MKRLIPTLLLTALIGAATLGPAGPASAGTSKCKNTAVQGGSEANYTAWSVTITKVNGITCKEAKKTIKANCKNGGMKGWKVTITSQGYIVFRKGSTRIDGTPAGGPPPCAPDA